jgi:hypothetical protein
MSPKTNPGRHSPRTLSSIAQANQGAQTVIK